MVEYLAGNRIIGNTAERPNAGVAGWKEVARLKASDTDISNIPNKKYYMVLGHNIQGSGNSGLGMQFNGDTTGGRYPRRYTSNGTSNASPTSESNIFFDTFGSTQTNKQMFNTIFISNEKDEEKLGIYNTVYNRDGVGEDEHPSRINGSFKWTNTTDVINRIKLSDFNGTAMNADSEVVVLGYDPADTHTDNFWEQLASEEETSGGEFTISFTAKKYLWIQYQCTSRNPTQTGLAVRFNSDSGTNYAQRFQEDGGTEYAGNGQINQAQLSLIHSGGSLFFGNMFIVNDNAREKLIINNQVAKISSTGGSSEAVRRWDRVGKYDPSDISDQISSITFIDTEQGSLGVSKGIVKVWGHD